MSGKQSAVLWLGLLLIVVRLFTTNQWSNLWGTVGTKVPSGSVNPPAADVPDPTGIIHGVHPNIV